MFSGACNSSIKRGSQRRGGSTTLGGMGFADTDGELGMGESSEKKSLRRVIRELRSCPDNLRGSRESCECVAAWQ